MTHIKFMNDASEYSYAMNLIGQELEEIEKCAPEIVSQVMPTPESKGEHHLNEWLNPLKVIMDDITSIDVFIASFSEMVDDISQWRGYCPKLGGFCIGFESEGLVDLAKKQDYLLTSCIYKTSDQISIIREIIHSFFSDTENILNDTKSENRAELTREMIKLIMHTSRNYWKIGSVIKNASFENEKEWRISSTSYKEVKRLKYIPGNSMIIPYINFPLTRDTFEMPIREIIIGPTPHPELSEQSVKMLLSSNGLKCDVKQSKIPYRAW